MPATDEGAAAEPGSLPDSLWPLGDEVATALLGLLEVELRGRGLRWRVVARERLEVGRTDLPWPGTLVDLAPLRERMRDRVKADWPELIEQYVSDLRTSAARSAPALGETSWRRAMEPLRARILPADTTHAALGGALQRLVVDGLVEAIVTEAPPAARTPRNGERGERGARADGAGSQGRGRGRSDGRVNDFGSGSGTSAGAGHDARADSGFGSGLCNGIGIGGELVSAGEALDWGVAEHVLFDAARANVRRDTALEAERFTIDGTELIALFSPSHYAATHVLWLAEHLAGLPGYIEANGALVVLPHRHLITVHPIESSAVVAAAGTLLRFAARQFETCPGPLSDQLYWWQGGTLSRLPSDSVGETLQLFPSDRFAALLDRLRAGRRLGDEPPGVG